MADGSKIDRQAQCSCMEVFGEDPSCQQHGIGTDYWALAIVNDPLARARTVETLRGHDARISELLAANSREVERRRELEEEVAFWRREQLCRLLLLTAVATKEDRPDLRYEIRGILSGFKDADAKEWHERCPSCREFIPPGAMVVTFGDEDETWHEHARCVARDEIGHPAMNVDAEAPDILAHARAIVADDA